MDKLQHVSTLFANEPQAALAKKIALAHARAAQLTKSFFTNSGTEANETAILTARCYTGNTEIVALRHSYHGRSAQAMTLSGPGRVAAGPTASRRRPRAQRLLLPLPVRPEYPDCEVRCAQDMEELIRTTTSGRIAGFIAEPIQGVGGFITPPKEYFRIVDKISYAITAASSSATKCRPAWGRTGSKWFGIEHWGVHAGYHHQRQGIGQRQRPSALTVARPEVADAVKGLTISTFGGNPVATTAAKAVLDYIEEQNLPRQLRGDRRISARAAAWN